MTIDPKLLEFAGTARQREIIQALIEHSTYRKAGAALNISHAYVGRVVEAVKKKATLGGVDDSIHHSFSNVEALKGTSTLVRIKDREDGSEGPTLQWVKTKVDDEQRLEMLEHAANILAEDIKGLAKPIKIPTINSNNKLLTVYPMGDPHIGMYAWKEECGDNFDVDIARANLAGAMKHLVNCAPASHTGLIVNLGDFFHMDNSQNRTLQSGHILDVDTRWPEVLELGILAMRDCIDMALAKHKKVVVINSIGNHDEHSSVMLSSNISAFYHNEKRLTVIPTRSKYQYYEFGKNLLGITHGDRAKMATLEGLMPADKPEAWGRTIHRYWLTGHIHSLSRIDLKGCTAESFRTLAAKDSYIAGGPWRSGRDMNAIVLHELYGEVSRYRCDISMLL